MTGQREVKKMKQRKVGRWNSLVTIYTSMPLKRTSHSGAPLYLPIARKPNQLGTLMSASLSYRVGDMATSPAMLPWIMESAKTCP